MLSGVKTLMPPTNQHADTCFYVGTLCQALFSKLYILISAYLQMLLLATDYRECCLCENGPLLSSSEHRPHFRGRFSPCFNSRTQRLLITQKTGCFPWKLDEKLLTQNWWLIRSGWSVLLSRWPPKALPTSIRADTSGQTPNAECARNALRGPVNKDAPSMKTVARCRAPSRYTGVFTNQDLSITKVYCR